MLYHISQKTAIKIISISKKNPTYDQVVRRPEATQCPRLVRLSHDTVFAAHLLQWCSQSVVRLRVTETWVPLHRHNYTPMIVTTNCLYICHMIVDSQHGQLPASGTGPPGQRSARTKVRKDKNPLGQKLNYATKWQNYFSLWENYGTHRHSQLMGQLAPNSLDFSQVALTVWLCN